MAAHVSRALTVADTPLNLATTVFIKSEARRPNSHARMTRCQGRIAGDGSPRKAGSG